jgi:hypothetical protein
VGLIVCACIYTARDESRRLVSPHVTGLSIIQQAISGRIRDCARLAMHRWGALRHYQIAAGIANAMNSLRPPIDIIDDR